MNYQLAKNISTNLKKEDLIQNLIKKNISDRKISCASGCDIGTGGNGF